PLQFLSCPQVSSSDLRPSAKRRRLNPAAIVPVPVYSSRVSSSLQLKPTACLLGGRESSDDGGDESLWAEFNPRRPAVVELSDSEEEPEPGRFRSKPAENQLGHAGCPSPPPPESPVQKQSSKARRKISEINKKLRAVSAVLSPEPPDQRTSRRRNRRNQRSDLTDDSDDVIIMSPADGSDSPREIPLKIRCRTDVHKVLVLPSTRLSEVLGRLAAILEVPPPRLLLLREELELPAGATVGQLGLGIADILAVQETKWSEKRPLGGGMVRWPEK
uniref:Nuclear factor of activated T cells 2 interacting protein n=1 Tax=Poecilia formosa TaxID=48698 RepID=A0A096MGP6_POEFO